MSRVVVAGRWDGGIPVLPTGDALAAIGRGVLSGDPGAAVVTVPVGTGPTFDEAVAGLRSQASFVRVPADASSSREAGVCVAETLGMQRTVIVEGGHNASPDCGIGFLEGLLGDSCIDPRRPEALADALTQDGYAATVRDIGGGTLAVQLCQGHCPIQNVAGDFPQLCDAETLAFGKLLDVHVQRLSTLAGGGHVCTTHIPVGMPVIRPGARNVRRK